MIILGIETSCDETAAAVVKDGTKILSNIVASSQDMHARTGGIIPEIAAREQIRSIIPVINETLTISHQSLSIKDIDAIAVTYGPGLIGSLLVGVETAKTLSLLWNKPIIPVNHLLGHVYANWLATPKPSEGGLPTFPLIALIVSGGHTDLVLMKNHHSIKLLGSTLDDAAGEAFDKTARLLGLGYPGGPAISKAAAKFFQSLTINHQSLNLLPRPMLDDSSYNFSFSGLKTAVLKSLPVAKAGNIDKYRLAAETQEAIVDCLVEKTMRAIKKYKPTCFLLAGGVAANSRLREKFQNRIQEENMWIGLHVPMPKLCTDNAAAIAACAFYNYRPVKWEQASASPQLTITN